MHTTLEQQLFSWDNWDEAGPMNVQFIDVVLRVPCGEFPIGEKFETAFFEGEISRLTLYRNGESYEFSLVLSIGKQLF